MSPHGIVIVGGGLAGQRCAETLRSCGYSGPIRIVCAEPARPYDRPPLSKELLAGHLGLEGVALRPARWYADNQVELLLGRRAVGIDPRQLRLDLDDGSALGFDDLLIATGSRARRLAALDRFSNVTTLRSIADAEHLRAALGAGARLAVIGAGFIGQEVAATAVRGGAEVTMIEAMPLPLSRVLGDSVGRWLAGVHGDEGVRLHLGARLDGTRGNGRLEELRLVGGERIYCDFVVVGVGISPATDWLEASGLADDGIPTDRDGRTRVPHVYAAGDACRPFDATTGRHHRSEHWEAAARQGAAAARAMLGIAPTPTAVPSFWSDQYGLRMQYVGRAEMADAHRVEGDPAARDFHVVYLRAGSPVAAFTVARPRELASLRKQIEQANHTGVTSDGPDPDNRRNGM
jgi:NADPH-dependent 2,4-dienoyl-CoA reductase/sulfur reductase-like enzyme